MRGLREYISQPVAASFFAGGIAGAVSRTVVSPLERLKIIFQVQGPGNSSYQGVGPALAKMWREEGWRGYMRWVNSFNSSSFLGVTITCGRAGGRDWMGLIGFVALAKLWYAN